MIWSRLSVTMPMNLYPVREFSFEFEKEILLRKNYFSQFY